MGLRKPKVDLGKKYRDKVTGFEGIATSKTDYIYGCTRVGLEALVDNGEIKINSFDEPALELVEEKPVVKEAKAKTGGPRPAPVRTGH